LIIGPKAIGKTAHSVELARQVNAPVLALDRVQCCPELAVGGGRPTEAELQGTKRIYLTERRASDGVLSAEDAVALLVDRVRERWSAGSEYLVVEGGSISMLLLLARSSRWMGGADLLVEHLREPSGPEYEQRVRRRVEGMLGPAAEGRTILDEIRALWPDERARPLLSAAVGYRALISLSHDNGIDPVDLGQMATRSIDPLVDCVLQDHLAHAEEQRRELARAMVGLRRYGVELQTVPEKDAGRKERDTDQRKHTAQGEHKDPGRGGV
jgi:hypothetical protein